MFTFVETATASRVAAPLCVSTSDETAFLLPRLIGAFAVTLRILAVLTGVRCYLIVVLPAYLNIILNVPVLRTNGKIAFC